MIYICIPARDEARTLGPLLWKVRKVMADFDRHYRVVVLDDASTDDTAAVLERYDSSLPITALRTEERLGYGQAVERLLRHVSDVSPYPKRDCAVLLQADLTEDPADLVPLVKALEGGADIVAGVSAGGAGPEPRGVRVVRWLSPFVLGRAHRSAPVADPMTGMRAYRVVVLQKALRDREAPVVRTEHPFPVSVELLKLLAPHARRIEEAPVAVRHRLRTRASRFVPLRVLRDLLKVRGGRWETNVESEAGRAA